MAEITKHDIEKLARLAQIEISDETSEVLETGGGLKKAAWYFEQEQHFVLMNVDILTDLNLTAMIQQHQQNQVLATLAVTERNTSRYFLFNENNMLCGWKNVHTNEEKIVRQDVPLVAKAFSGVHVIDTAIFSLMQQKGKFSMVDVYLSVANTNLIQSFDHSGGKLLDVGKPESIVKAEQLFV